MVIQEQGYPDLDLEDVEDWSYVEHFDALRSTIRLEQSSSILRLVALTPKHSALVWQFANKAVLIPGDAAKDVVVELTLAGFKFPIGKTAGPEIQTRVTAEDRALLDAFFASRSKTATKAKG